MCLLFINSQGALTQCALVSMPAPRSPGRGGGGGGGGGSGGGSGGSPSNLELASKIFVGGLAPQVGETELRAHFGKFGTVASAQVLINRESGREWAGRAGRGAA